MVGPLDVPTGLLVSFGWEKLCHAAARRRMRALQRYALRQAVGTVLPPQLIDEAMILIADLIDHESWETSLLTASAYSGRSVHARPATHFAKSFYASLRQVDSATIDRFRLNVIAEHFGANFWDGIVAMARRKRLPTWNSSWSASLATSSHDQSSLMPIPSGPASPLWGSEARQTLMEYESRLIQESLNRFAPHLDSEDPAHRIWIPPVFHVVAEHIDSQSGEYTSIESEIAWPEACELLNQPGAWVVLEGPPGCGKTSAAIRLLALAVEASTAAADLGRIPIFLTPDDLQVIPEASTPQALCEDLRDRAVARYPRLFEQEEPSELLLSYIDNGQIALMIDWGHLTPQGLTVEVGFRRYSETIGDEATIVTCRRSGVRRKVGEVVATLAPLTPPQTERYFHATGLDRVQQSRARALVDGLSSRGGSISPLHASMAYLVARYNLDTQEATLADLYMTCARFLVGGRWNNQALSRNLDERLATSTRLAVAAARNSEGWHETVGSEELQAVSRQHSLSVEDLANNGLFMMQSAEPAPRYQFIHRSMQEFLVALDFHQRWCLGEVPSPGDTIIWDLEWTNVFRFVCQLHDSAVALRWLADESMHVFCPLHQPLWRLLLVAETAGPDAMQAPAVQIAFRRHVGHLDFFGAIELALFFIVAPNDVLRSLLTAITELDEEGAFQIASALCLALPQSQDLLVDHFELLSELSQSLALIRLSQFGLDEPRLCDLLLDIIRSPDRTPFLRKASLSGIATRGGVPGARSLVTSALNDEDKDIRDHARECCSYRTDDELLEALRLEGRPASDLHVLRPEELPQAFARPMGHDFEAQTRQLRALQTVQKQAEAIGLVRNGWFQGEVLSARQFFLDHSLSMSGSIAGREEVDRAQWLCDGVVELALARTPELQDWRFAEGLLLRPLDGDANRTADRLAAAMIALRHGAAVAIPYLVSRLVAGLMHGEAAFPIEAFAMCRVSRSRALTPLLGAVALGNGGQAVSAAMSLVGDWRFDVEECVPVPDMPPAELERLLLSCPPHYILHGAGLRQSADDAPWLAAFAARTDAPMGLRQTAIRVLSMLPVEASFGHLAELSSWAEPDEVREAAFILGTVVVVRSSREARLNMLDSMLQHPTVGLFAQISWPLLQLDLRAVGGNGHVISTFEAVHRRAGT